MAIIAIIAIRILGLKLGNMDTVGIGRTGKNSRGPFKGCETRS